MTGTLIQWSISTIHTHIRTTSTCTVVPCTRIENTRKGSLVYRSILLEWWSGPPMHDPRIFSILNTQATLYLDHAWSPVKNIRKSGYVPDHDNTMLTKAPKITSIRIHDRHTFSHHGPQHESTGTESHVLTPMILDQVDDWYLHALIHIHDRHSYVPHALILSYCGPMPNDGEHTKGMCCV